MPQSASLPSTESNPKVAPDDPDLMRGAYRFYRCNSPVQQRTSLPEGYWWTMWQPTWGDLWPREATELRHRAKFLFRTAVHFLGLFAGDECGALLILRGKHLAHYSQFSPRYWRFPAMRRDDLQIGDTWTAPEDRGRGLASFALERVVAAHYRPERNFWYVVGARNAPSIRVVEKAGFTLVGTGLAVKTMGLRLLTSYVMKEAANPPPAAAQH